MPDRYPRGFLEGFATSTQPVVFGVAGATFLGLSVNDWILIGTGVLLVMNLGIAAAKLIQMWRDRK